MRKLKNLAEVPFEKSIPALEQVTNLEIYLEVHDHGYELLVKLAFLENAALQRRGLQEFYQLAHEVCDECLTTLTA